MDCSLKPPERSGLFMGRGIKRKRGLDENGGPLSEPEEGPPATYTNSWEQRRKIKSKLKRKGDAKVSAVVSFTTPLMLYKHQKCNSSMCKRP